MVNISNSSSNSINLTSNNTSNVAANNNGNSQRARSWAVGQGLIDGEDYSAKHYAQLSRQIEQEIASDTNYAHIWAEGTDEQVQALGGTHSSMGWVNYVLTNPPTASIEQTEIGATITVHDINGTTTADLTNGVSPVAYVTQTEGGATVTVIDGNGTTTADLTNGIDGVDGAAATISVGTVTTGAAGSSATVRNRGTSSAAVFDFTIPKGDTGNTGATGNGISSISKTSTSGLVDTYTILYTNTDTDTFTVTNGANGQDGEDGEAGFSPTATVTKSGTVATITITDKNGTTTETVSDGEQYHITFRSWS